MLGVTSLITLFAALHTSATPFHALTDVLPRDVSHIGLDEARLEFVAYNRDGTLYGRYPATVSTGLTKRASQCGDLSVEDAQKLPGWDTIEQYANNNWGNGSRNLETNPAGYLSQPAQFCITDEVVELTFEGDPICQMHTTSTNGQLIGTTGEVSIEVDQGFNTDASYTISEASSVGVSSTLEVKVGIPEVADVTESVTVSTEVTDTLSSTLDVSYNDVSKVTIRMTASEGETCTAEATINTCNIQATGSIRYYATGWVWFNYDDKTKEHYKWAAHIDAILTNLDDRSTWAKFSGSMSSNTHAAYEGKCACVD